jgi:exodeoxyribonuclease V alpha subunit
MESLRCVVERITFENTDNGYCVIKVAVKGESGLVTVVGNMTSVNVGSVLSLKGEWTNNSKYGKQFAAEEWEETLPATVYGIEKYLGSGLIKGIGPVYAKKIVAYYGIDTLRILEEEPGSIINVPGIGAKRVGMIKDAWVEQKEIKNVMLFLQGHGVSTSHAVKIYKKYGNDSINTVTTNPYKLADDIWGIGFKTADTIASKLGFAANSFVRCRSGLLYTLNELSGDGHCYATREQLVSSARVLLAIEEVQLVMTLDNMIKEYDVIFEEPDFIYTPPLYHSEVGSAKRINDILINKPQKSELPDFSNAPIEYNETQKSAIICAMNSKVMVLTGGPGTGKTTTVLGIISMFKDMNMKVLLAAPTGRAAKRMTETTGEEAKTIHRLLEYKPPEGYQLGAENPLRGDVLIIDEASMIDIVLAYNLLKAVQNKMRVIIVGDVDQLPSVGPGNFLRDIINSGAVPVIKLNYIFRQAHGSDIVVNAHKINEGDFPDLSGGKNSDFFFIEEEDNAAIPEIIVDLCARRLPKHYKVNPISDIQVLCPMLRSENGSINLNSVLQSALNKNKIFLSRGSNTFKLGDKVMQIRNNYDKNVFNGDIGIIIDINSEEDILVINFDDNMVRYEVSELDEVVLAYATTIHKSQGSEYPIVVMPLTMQFFVMLQKNLLYTGITRARRVVVIVGSKKAIQCAVQNNKVIERNTRLAERLRDNNV